MSASDDGRPRRRSRRLSDEERLLWKGVAKSVTPLRRHVPADPEPDPSGPAASAETKPRRRPPPQSPSSPPSPRPASPPLLETLGRREKKKIARGRAAIDARIDLHGRTQAEAYDALIGFIRRSQMRGARTVLVITGKGRRESADGESGGGRGVLRRQVPMWLGLPELRDCVVGFEPASVGHGGEGALYVRLRKDRGALTP